MGLFKSRKENQRRREEQERSLITGEVISKYLLTVSAGDYVSSIGRGLSNFELRSVDASYSMEGSLEKTVFECKRRMVENGKGLGAEVIVDVKPTVTYQRYYDQPVYMIGTALIPKKE